MTIGYQIQEGILNKKEKNRSYSKFSLIKTLLTFCKYNNGINQRKRNNKKKTITIIIKAIYKY